MRTDRVTNHHTILAARVAVGRLAADLEDAGVKVGKAHIDTLCWLLGVTEHDILAAQLWADTIPATAKPPEVFRD